MSGIPMNSGSSVPHNSAFVSSNANNTTSSAFEGSAQPPTWHIHHDSSDPLPGVKGAPAPADYSTNAFDRTSSNTWNEAQENSFVTGQGHGGVQHRTGSAQGENAFNSNRPMNVQPTEAGGVAVGGHSDLPEGKATFGDKIVGKTQKVMGKAMNKPEMHEKGELRESGGKAAALGQARAPHD
ncbi:hypothetical protein HGRIS_007021 [Hohenbuehelia grisea]|uniref:Uncharacterized protein n=1 Tax=Hohenbuehelia grisea TaxID=104357 RepID=A0ABR3JBY7_9AGAR